MISLTVRGVVHRDDGPPNRVELPFESQCDTGEALIRVGEYIKNSFAHRQLRITSIKIQRGPYKIQL